MHSWIGASSTLGQNVQHIVWKICKGEEKACKSCLENFISRPKSFFQSFDEEEIGDFGFSNLELRFHLNPLKYMENMGILKEDATEVVNLSIKSLQSINLRKNKQSYSKGCSESKNSCFFMENWSKNKFINFHYEQPVKSCFFFQ